MSTYKSPDRNKIRFELVATDGDCGPNGMSDVADRRPVRNKHLPLVMEFLRAALETTLQSATQCLTGRIDAGSWDRQLMDKYNYLGGALIDLNVFKHKWHLRTSWRLAECIVEYDTASEYHKYFDHYDNC